SFSFTAIWPMNRRTSSTRICSIRSTNAAYARGAGVDGAGAAALEGWAQAQRGEAGARRVLGVGVLVERGQRGDAAARGQDHGEERGDTHGSIVPRFAVPDTALSTWWRVQLQRTRFPLESLGFPDAPTWAESITRRA